MSDKKIKGHTSVHAPARTSHAASLKPWQADVIACVAMFLAVFVMFYQIPLEGKGFSRGDDTESGASMTQFADREASVRDFPMWCPYVFGGFPGLAAGAYSNYEAMGFPYAIANRVLSPRYWADFITTRVLFLGGTDHLSTGSPRWILAALLYGGLFTYLLMRRLGFGPLIAYLSGLIIAWNPYLISLATAAHGGKLMTFIYTPLILLLAWNVFEKRRLLDLGLLALGLGWQIAVGGHTQILFYSMVMVGILYVVWAGFELKQAPSARVFVPAVFVAAAVLLAFSVGALWYIPLLKYLPWSIRGLGPAIAQSGGQAGYSLADATMWSFHPREILTFIVPSWFGLKSPYYWGDMPFTSSSFYFGVVPLLFAVLAFFGRKDRLFWGLLAVTIFSFLLSFGSHFESFYALFFNLLPFFNKFRTPSLILLLVVLCGIVFAGYGLRFVLNLTDEEHARWKKRFLYGAIICAGLLVVMALAGGAFSGLFGSFSKAGESSQYSPEQVNQIRAMRFDMLKNDLLLALLWLGIAFAACWALLTRKITTTVFLLIVVGITAVDLWRVSHKFFDPQPAASTLETLKPNEIVRTLRADNSVFRVMPLGRLMQDNRWANWEIPSLGGYHGAKMRSYQDLVDNVMFRSPDPNLPLNMNFLSAMNCKYFVAEGQLPPVLNLELVKSDPASKWVLYRNPRVTNRVFFADSVLVVADRTQAMQRMMDRAFMWDYMAVVDQPLPGPVVKNSDRVAEITNYTPHLVKIHARNAAPAFLVLTDAYYSPGWAATDNGRDATIYKVDNFVRGLYLQPGDHVIEYRYMGKYEKRGVLVATVSHFLVWGLVIGAFLYERKRRHKVTA